MALTFLDVVSAVDLDEGLALRVVDVTFDNSYPTGGEAVTAAQLQLAAITHVIPVLNSALADKHILWDAANSKLQIQVMSTAAEAANASDQSTVTTRLLAIGTPEA